jgi:hypothetical protein
MSLADTEGPNKAIIVNTIHPDLNPASTDGVVATPVPFGDTRSFDFRIRIPSA